MGYDEKPVPAYLQDHPSRCAGTRRCQLPRLVIFSSLFVAASGIGSAQTQPTNPASPLPDAPLPIIKHGNSKSGPCRVIPKSESAGIALSETGSGLIAAAAGFPPVEEAASSAASSKSAEPVSPRAQAFATNLSRSHLVQWELDNGPIPA